MESKEMETIESKVSSDNRVRNNRRSKVSIHHDPCTICNNYISPKAVFGNQPQGCKVRSLDTQQENCVDFSFHGWIKSFGRDPIYAGKYLLYRIFTFGKMPRWRIYMLEEKKN